MTYNALKTGPLWGADPSRVFFNLEQVRHARIAFFNCQIAACPEPVLVKPKTAIENYIKLTVQMCAHVCLCVDACPLWDSLFAFLQHDTNLTDHTTGACLLSFFPVFP